MFKTKPLVSLLFTFATNLLCNVFLTILLFTILLSLLKSIGKGFKLSISIFSTSAFKLAKSDFAANLEVSIPIAFFKSVFVA